MGFVAQTAVDVLDFDFRPFVDVQGVTPEPSKVKVQKFQRAVKNSLRDPLVEQARREEEGEHKVTAAELEAALSDNNENDVRGNKILDDLITAVAELCSNQPSAASIKKLPWRIQQHYIGYIAGKFLGEASTPVTTQ